jgi:hypothetical protein
MGRVGENMSIVGLEWLAGRRGSRISNRFPQPFLGEWSVCHRDCELEAKLFLRMQPHRLGSLCDDGLSFDVKLDISRLGDFPPRSRGRALSCPTANWAVARLCHARATRRTCLSPRHNRRGFWSTFFTKLADLYRNHSHAFVSYFGCGYTAHWYLTFFTIRQVPDICHSPPKPPSEQGSSLISSSFVRPSHHNHVW